jgi:hypothetical protein
VVSRSSFVLVLDTLVCGEDMDGLYLHVYISCENKLHLVYLSIFIHISFYVRHILLYYLYQRMLVVNIRSFYWCLKLVFSCF